MNVGLVLSAGAAKGAYQIGALRAISEFVPKDDIKYISGSSIGILNGYAYETDSIDAAERMWRNINPSNKRIYMNQILRSGELQRDIIDLYNKAPCISKTFYAALLNLRQKKLVYKELSSVGDEDIHAYLRASIASPILNRSVLVDGYNYFDGGYVDAIPVYPLLKHKLDYVICIYFDENCYKFESSYFDNKVIKLGFSSQGLKQTLIVTKDSIDEMIKDGYEKTKYTLRYVFSEGTDNLDHIYRTIEFLNRGSELKTRTTAQDVLVTNLNKVTQSLTKRKIL